MQTFGLLRRFWLRLLLLSAIVCAPACMSAQKTKTFSVAQYGTKGDGVTLDTAAIQRAIDAAAEHGGIVTFPGGTYLTGSLFVKSNVTLRVDKGVTLLGSQRLEDYPEMPTRVAGIEMIWPSHRLVSALTGPNWFHSLSRFGLTQTIF